MSELKPKQLPPAPSEADVLRWMLNTPPTPHVPQEGETQAQKAGQITVSRETKQRLLKRAAELVGEDVLAAQLRVPKARLEAWLRGHASMPDRKLLQLADLFEKLSDQKVVK